MSGTYRDFIDGGPIDPPADFDLDLDPMGPYPYAEEDWHEFAEYCREADANQTDNGPTPDADPIDDADIPF